MKTITFVHPHAGNINVGSYRLQTLAPVRFLERQFNSNYKFEIVKDVAEAMASDIIICMQINDIGRALEIKKTKPQIKIVGFQSDGPRGEPALLRQLDAVVIDSVSLEWSIPDGVKRLCHFPTPLEFPAGKYEAKKFPGGKQRIVYLGAKGNLFFAFDRIQALRAKGFDISILSDCDTTDIKWNVETYADDLNKFDVGIVPYPTNLQVPDDHGFTNFFYKDPSRPTVLQAVGLPVVVAPLPSYLGYIQHGENGLIANTDAEWMECLSVLQTDSEVYERISAQGLHTSRSVSNTSLDMWRRLICLLCADNA